VKRSRLLCRCMIFVPNCQTNAEQQCVWKPQMIGCNAGQRTNEQANKEIYQNYNDDQETRSKEIRLTSRGGNERIATGYRRARSK